MGSYEPSAAEVCQNADVTELSATINQTAGAIRCASFPSSADLVDPQAVVATLELMGKKGLAIEIFADNSIIDRLVREGFIDQVYKKR